MPAIGSKFALKRKFLADHADVSLDLASPNVPFLTQALQIPFCRFRLARSRSAT